jgi:hypothetical protein
LKKADPVQYMIKKGFTMANTDEFRNVCSHSWTILGRVSINQPMY